MLLKKGIKFFKEIKTEKIFFLFFSLWTIDLVTTFIALNFVDNIVEKNPIANVFFSMGIWGSLCWVAFGFFSFLGLSYTIERAKERVNNDKKVSKIAWLCSFLPIFIFYILEGGVIINNIKNLL